MRIKVVSYRDDKAFVDARYVDSKYVPMIIANAEMKAKQNEINAKASHIVYAVKYFNRGDSPYKLTIYEGGLPMSNTMFEQTVASLKDVQVYAIHRI